MAAAWWINTLAELKAYLIDDVVKAEAKAIDAMIGNITMSVRIRPATKVSEVVWTATP